MSGFVIFVDVVVVAWMLLRQRWVRPVPYRLRLGAPAFLFVLGLFVLARFGADHHLTGTVVAGLALRFAVGALGLGLLAGWSVRIWLAGPFLLRRGTWVTFGLWVLSLLVLAGTGWVWSAARGPADLAWASLLAYVGTADAAQRLAVHRRGRALRALDGPIDARAETIEHPGAPGPSPETPGSPPVIDVRSFDRTEPDGPPPRG